MIRTDSTQLDLWSALLPGEVWGLPEELRKVDGLLDNPAVLRPLAEVLDPDQGRPSLPLTQVLRLLYLKDRYQLSDAVLLQEVSDSIHWRRFCRLGLTDPVPHSTSLTKWRHRLGPEAIAKVNAAVIDGLRDEKVIRGRRLRIDSTVVEANIHYPTDSQLVADGLRKVTRVGRKIRELLGDGVERLVDHSRSVQRRLLRIAKHLRHRTGRAVQKVREVTAEIAQIAESQMRVANRIGQQAKEALAATSDQVARPARRLAERLEQTQDLLGRVIAQHRAVLRGEVHIPDRVVSLADPDARPIVKGKLGKPVQFGYKTQIIEAEGGFVTDYTVDRGNPPDADALLPALHRHKTRFRRAPGIVAADRGYDKATNHTGCYDLGVRNVAIPKRGKVSADRRRFQQRRSFRRAQAWRSGSEATISRLKRNYGLGRSRYRGYDRVATGVGLAIFAHNLRRAASR